MLKIWDLDTGACLATWADDAAITAVAFVGDRVVAGTEGGALLLLAPVPSGRWPCRGQ